MTTSSEQRDEHSGHDHNVSNANAKALLISLVLTASFMGAEVVAGIAFNSLALLSDAAHMGTDAAALAIALLALRIARRPADARRSYGYGRLETLAAGFNALMLLGVSVFVLIEAAQRIRQPVEVQTWGMLTVAAVGLAVNLIAMRVLRGRSETSLNLRGAYLEVWADMIGSIGVIVGAIAVKLTGWNWIDVAVGVAIGLWIVPRSWMLLKVALHGLLEGTPSTIDPEKVRDALASVDGVVAVHDLHIWNVGQQTPLLTAHVVIANPESLGSVLNDLSAVLQGRFKISHSTVQCEPVAEAQPHEPLHP